MTPITFPNQDGLRLFGMLHQPAVPREGAETVLILSPGVKMRVAPHRLYNKLAERFVAMGYTVLRFDFHGLGDSEGTAPESAALRLLLRDAAGAIRGRHGRRDGLDAAHARNPALHRGGALRRRPDRTADGRERRPDRRALRHLHPRHSRRVQLGTRLDT